MTPLLAAVYDQLKTDPAIIALVGTKIYAGRALNNVDMPYLVFQRQGSFPPVVYTTRASQVEHVIIRFHLWSTDSEQVTDGAASVEKLFRTTWPVLSAGTTMQATRQGDDLMIDPTPANNGDDVWHSVTDMDFMLQRDPTA